MAADAVVLVLLVFGGVATASAVVWFVRQRARRPAANPAAEALSAYVPVPREFRQ